MKGEREQGGPPGEAGRWVRVIAPLQGMEGGEAARLPGPFLRSGARPRGFWQRGDAWGAFAGSLTTLRVRDPGEDPFGSVRRRGARLLERVAEGTSASGAEASAPPLPRLYGGFAFRAGQPGFASRAGEPEDGFAGADDGFAGGDDELPLARFELPEVELRSDGERCWMALTAAVPPETSPEEARSAARERLAGLVERLLASVRGDDTDEEPGGRGPAPGHPGATDPETASVSELVTAGAWRREVAATLEAIRADEARKVVLARGLEVTFRRAPDPLAIFLRLRALYPGCFPFYLETAPAVAFLCASPELVGSRRGDCFHTTAVAGTTGRGRDAREDERLARQLLESVKNRSEHRIGVRDLRERLAEIAGAPKVDAEPRILRLRGIQHLQTNLSVRLPDRRHVLRMIGAVHPAAAVCGYPREAALRIVRRRERIRRGWYAGPVGWFDAAGDGEFAPGLRSATVRGERVRMLAGAGIVRGSDAAEEWDEISLKFRPLREALGLAAGDGRDGKAGPAEHGEAGSGEEAAAAADRRSARETVSVSEETEAGPEP